MGAQYRSPIVLVLRPSSSSSIHPFYFEDEDEGRGRGREKASRPVARGSPSHWTLKPPGCNCPECTRSNKEKTPAWPKPSWIRKKCGVLPKSCTALMASCR